MERRNRKGSGLANEGVPPRAEAGDKLARWAALGRGVVCADDDDDDAGEEVLRLEAVTGVWADNFDAGSPGVLKGEPDLELAEDDFTPVIGDSDLGDVLVLAPTYISLR